MQNLGLFIAGIRDSVSCVWISKILLYTHPRHKRAHPSSYKMLTILGNSFMQVIICLIGIPQLFKFFGFKILASVIGLLFLLLTFGWFFFYNSDIITFTRQVALWGKEANQVCFPELDKKQNVQFFTNISQQIKSIIFLVLFYMPIYMFALLISFKLPIFGPILLVISESFFNSAFYFMKIWPYNKQNVGFIEKYWAYMLGYGLFVSFVCNIVLSGTMASGAYFLISQWMIINCILFGPPNTQYNSFSKILKQQPANIRGNAYSMHREKIRNDENYRKQITENIKILSLNFKITDMLNNFLNKIYGKYK